MNAANDVVIARSDNASKVKNTEDGEDKFHSKCNNTELHQRNTCLNMEILNISETFDEFRLFLHKSWLFAFTLVLLILFFVGEVTTSFINGVVQLIDRNDGVLDRVYLTAGIHLFEVAVVLFKGKHYLLLLFGHFRNMAHDVAHPDRAIILIFLRGLIHSFLKKINYKTKLLKILYIIF